MNPPHELGRSIVIRPGATVPPGWTNCVRHDVDSVLLNDTERLEGLVGELHRAWVSRTRVVFVLDLADGDLGAPQTTAVPSWDLGGGFTFLRERLHFLIWANSYDARRQPAVWWWGRKAERLGATLGGERDVVLVDAGEVWVDGGPRGDVHGLGVGSTVHAESVAGGVLTLEPGPSLGSRATDLAPDQQAAVLHGAGATRVIAPAGSGKTRTLGARLERLINDLAYPKDGVTVVAYNTRAAAELAQRVAPNASSSVRTLHALGRQVLFDGRGRLTLLSERDVRRMLEPMVPAIRRPNTDVIGPYIEALSEVRIGLRSPAEVESQRDDVPGFEELFDRYRQRLRGEGAHDFDEQIFGAIELLLADADLRSRWQRTCRHVLVDEFQDLTPSYLLMIRLLASPGLDVFGVGDDDQVIYGYAGADPSFLIDYDRYFPGAGEHALRMNYRSPKPIVEAAIKLLSNNERRIEKDITSHNDDDGGFDVRRVDAAEAAPLVVSTVVEWSDQDVDLDDMAILCRVNSALLPVHAGLVDGGIPVRSPISSAVLDRTVMAAALAWIRIGLDPEQILRGDLFSIIRRPSRGLGRVVSDLVGGRASVSRPALREMRRSLDGRQRDRWDGFVSDVDVMVRSCSSGDSVQAVETLVTGIGLDRAAAALDSGRTRADRSGQSDDLRALRRVAALHPALHDFEPWLRRVVRVPDDPSGVLLTTVHRVKGLEWDRVIVYGADTGLMPHDLADDWEEERRVFHVAVTRGRSLVMVIADRARTSRFVDEAQGIAPPVEVPTKKRSKAVDGVQVSIGDEVTLSGGFRGVVERMLPIGVLVELRPGPGRLSVQWGESIGVGSSIGRLAVSGVTADAGLVERLKAWRLEISRTNAVPAYVVLADASLEELAKRRPRNEDELLSIKGIGPAKLEAYGDDLLGLVADG